MLPSLELEGLLELLERVACPESPLVGEKGEDFFFDLDS
jgi:hypothetical protein